MLFFETSAKTNFNIDELFNTSAREVAKKISQGYYDLTNETCGIKQGMSSGMNSNNLQLTDRGNNNLQKKNKKCC